jgi:hypothetical protein
MRIITGKGDFQLREDDAGLYLVHCLVCKQPIAGGAPDIVRMVWATMTTNHVPTHSEECGKVPRLAKP